MIPSATSESITLLDLTRQGRTRLDTLHKVLTSDGHFGTGASRTETVYAEGCMRLLRVQAPDGQPRQGPPVLFVPAPVSRYFILDLLPERSYAGHVAEAGFDVFILDFGVPGKEDRFADLEYYVEGLLHRAVRVVSRLNEAPAVNMVGYCLGGTLSLLYAALHPERVAKLVLLTTLVNSDVEGGIAWMAKHLGVPGEDHDNPRLVPAAVIKSWFEMLAPGSNSQAGRVTDLWKRLDSPVKQLHDVRAMATWVDDVVPTSGRLLAELSRMLGPDTNALMNGTAKVGSHAVDTSRITMPLMSVSADKDTIAPPDGVEAITGIVPHAQLLRLPGGHVGIVAGRAAAALWDRTVGFLRTGESDDVSR